MNNKCCNECKHAIKHPITGYKLLDTLICARTGQIILMRVADKVCCDNYKKGGCKCNM